jgi:hypothetical protein
VGAIEIDNPDAHVVLKGLHLLGSVAPAGSDGILITAAASVHIEDCVIERFPGDGIDTAADADAAIFVRRTISRDNDEHGLKASVVGSANALLAVDSSLFENNGGGGVVAQQLPALVTRSVMAGNGAHGFYHDESRAHVSGSVSANNGLHGFTSDAPSTSANLTLVNSTSRENGFRGLRTSANATARISNSVFTNNSIGIENNGVLLTRGNNTNAGNGTDYTGNASLPLPPQ